MRLAFLPRRGDQCADVDWIHLGISSVANLFPQFFFPAVWFEYQLQLHHRVCRWTGGCNLANTCKQTLPRRLHEHGSKLLTPVVWRLRLCWFWTVSGALAPPPPPRHQKRCMECRRGGGIGPHAQHCWKQVMFDDTYVLLVSVWAIPCSLRSPKHHYGTRVWNFVRVWG